MKIRVIDTSITDFKELKETIIDEFESDVSFNIGQFLWYYNNKEEFDKHYIINNIVISRPNKDMIEKLGEKTFKNFVEVLLYVSPLKKD